MTNDYVDTSKPEWAFGFRDRNLVYDHVMRRLSGDAFKVFETVKRKTWGFVLTSFNNNSIRKKWDVISYSQFQEMTGIGSRRTLSRAIHECLGYKKVVTGKTTVETETGEMKEKGVWEWVHVGPAFIERRAIGKHFGTGQPIYEYSLHVDWIEAVNGGILEAGTEGILEAGTEAVLGSGTGGVLTNNNANMNKQQQRPVVVDSFSLEEEETGKDKKSPAKKIDQENSRV